MAGWGDAQDNATNHQQSSIKCGRKICELIHEDHHWTIHQLSHTARISYGICQQILMENQTCITLVWSCLPALDTLKGACSILICALSFMRWLTTTQISPLGSSLAMKSGFMAMIQGQNNSHHIGRVCSHQDQKKAWQAQSEKKIHAHFLFVCWSQGHFSLRIFSS